MHDSPAKASSILARLRTWLQSLGWYGAAVAAIYAAAVGVRLWRWLNSYISGDGAVCGQLGLGVLEGRWPLFFWGQDFMGALDGYLAAPIYALFGASTLTLNIWAPLLSLATMVLLHLCLRRFFSRPALLVALVYMALPTALAIFHAGKPNNHYPMGLFLSALLMYLTLEVWRRERWGFWLPLSWGLVLGLAAWTNLQDVTVIAACGVFLLLTCLKRLRPLPLAAAALGALLGAGPLIYYNLRHGWEYASQAGLFSWHYLLLHSKLWFYNAFPLVLGFNTPSAKGSVAPGTLLFFLYLLVAAAVIWGAGLLLWRARQRPQRGLLLPVLVIFFLLDVLLDSVYGKELADWDLRYVLPIYLALPFCWAALAQRLQAWQGWLAYALGAALLAVNLAGWPGFWGGFMFTYGDTYRRVEEPRLRGIIAQMRQAGFTHLYAGEPDSLDFLAMDRIMLCDPWRDKRLYISVQVDAHLNPGFYGMSFRSFSFLGLPYRVDHPKVAHAFGQPQQVERFLPRRDWRARTTGGRDLSRALSDGDLATGLTLHGAAAKDQGFVLDLGHLESVAGLALVPADFREVPSGLRVEAAAEDGVFHLVRQIDGYWGPLYVSGPHPMVKARYPRVESYFPARSMRYLRVTHWGGRHGEHPWTTQEVLLWGPGPATPAPSWPESGRQLIEALTRLKVQRLFADAWPAALIAYRLQGKVWTVPANFATDDYGYLRPSPFEPLAIDPRPGSTLAVLQREAAATAQALARWGARFTRQDAGRYALFLLQGLEPRPPALPPAAVSSPLLPEVAARLAQGLPQGERWTSLQAQQPGMTLSLDLGRARQVEWLVLDYPHSRQDFPRGLALEVSQDGRAWQPAALEAAGPLAFSGHLPLVAPLGRAEYCLTPPVTARHLRLRLTHGHPVNYWSLERLSVLGR